MPAPQIDQHPHTSPVSPKVDDGSEESLQVAIQYLNTRGIRMSTVLTNTLELRLLQFPSQRIILRRYVLFSSAYIQ